MWISQSSLQQEQTFVYRERALHKAGEVLSQFHCMKQILSLSFQFTLRTPLLLEKEAGGITFIKGKQKVFGPLLLEEDITQKNG